MADRNRYKSEAVRLNAYEIITNLKREFRIPRVDIISWFIEKHEQDFREAFKHAKRKEED